MKGGEGIVPDLPDLDLNPYLGKCRTSRNSSQILGESLSTIPNRIVSKPWQSVGHICRLDARSQRIKSKYIR